MSDPIRNARRPYAGATPPFAEGVADARPWRAACARGARAAAAIAALAATAGLGSSCFTSSDGLNPPVGTVYFPTALVVSPGRSTLYVTSSDFDLQYNGGTVLALDLAGSPGVRTSARQLAVAIDDAVKNGGTQADACSALGLTINAESFVHPGPCDPFPIIPFVRAYATVGAFASQATLLTRPGGQPGARLFVTVRGDPSVTYFDVVDDRDPANPVSPCGSAFCLDCGGTGAGKRCSSAHLIGTDPFDNLRQVKLPTEPIGIDGLPIAGATGDPLVIAHQSSNQASLVVNRWPDQGPAGPTLEFALTGLSDGPTGVAHIPPPKVIAARNGLASYSPGFIVTHRAAAELSVLRYLDDGRSEPERPFLVKAATVPITVSATGNDSRGVAIDSSKRDACEAKCDAQDVACLTKCLDEPLDLYVASRAPASLLTGRIEAVASTDKNLNLTSVTENVVIENEIPLPVGPSNVAVGQVVDGNGKLVPRVFVVSFDSRFISVYDPHAPDAPPLVIRTGRGPFGIAFDSTPGDPGAGNAESYLYVSQFTDSYLSVVDLDERRRSFGSVVLNIGDPEPPKGEQR